jgi:MFS family permease
MDETAARSSWTPMTGLFLAQVLMSFNVAALPISLGGMVEDFSVPPTVASSTIVVYGLAVAALVMTGAKLGQLLAPTITWAIVGQLLAGAAAAIIVPALVALIAENYRGAQQATAVGSLGSARAISGVSAFLIGGTLGTLVGWRPIFVITLALAVAVFALSFTLRSDRGDPSIRIDLPASALIGGAVVALTLGFNNLGGWGVLLAEEAAPFSVLGLSPAPVLVAVGIVLGQLFLVRTRRRAQQGEVPLVDLRVLGNRRERSAVYAMFIIVSMEAAVNFTVPIYIQVVQGRTPLDTSLAMMPFNLTVFVTATLIVRDRPGRAGDARVQRAGDRGAEAARGRRRLPARHHPEPRLRRGHRGDGRGAGDDARRGHRPRRPRASEAARGAGGPGRSGPGELRQQRRAARGARPHHRHRGAGRRGRGPERGAAPAHPEARVPAARRSQRGRGPARLAPALLPP